MNTRTQTMLMAARSLLENSGPELTSASDAFTVARRVLVTHDLVELVLAALCIEFGGPFRVTEGTSFTDLVAYVVDKFRDQDEKDILAARRTSLFNLNHARVRFKHHGDLLDAATTYPVVDSALAAVDLLCYRAVGSPLRSIDALASVAHDAIVENFKLAEAQIIDGEYRTALASIARGVSTAFWDFDVRGVRAGEASSEAALLLSGRGIDPASFLEMQRFLPELYSPFDEDPKFHTRLYGHEANWTEENAKFCWDTALTIVLRLQYARSVPQARKFYDQFEDVITVRSNASHCYRYKGSWFQDTETLDEIECGAGEMFTGKASGFYERRAHKAAEISMPLEEANWIRLDSHNLQETMTSSMLFNADELWFEAADVSLTYQESSLARRLRQHQDMQIQRGGD